MEKIYIVYGPDPYNWEAWKNVPLKYFKLREDAEKYASTLRDAYVGCIEVN